MARPKLNIDGELVEKLAAMGCKTTEIADYLGCSVDTLSRRFAEELTKGHSNMKMSLRRWQLEAARKGNVVMLIWLGKQYLGQADRQDQEISKTEVHSIKSISPDEYLIELKSRRGKQE